MGLETGTLISDLVTTNPAGGDPLSQGDDHIRLLKTVIKNDAVSKADLAHGGLTDSATGVLIPGYLYPNNPYTDTTFMGLLDTIRKYHMVPVIYVINPSDGPGTVWDGNYAAAIRLLKAAGARVLGYVSTAYAVRDPNLVKADVTAWATLYASTPVDGIFYDEMPWELGTANANITLYQDYYAWVYAKGLKIVVGNPGTNQQGPWYAAQPPTADIIVTWETGTYPTETDLHGNFIGGHVDYAYETNAILVHSQAFDAAEFAMMRKYAKWIWVTDDLLSPNPWDAYPTYMTSIFEACGGGGGGTSILDGAVPPTGLIGADGDYYLNTANDTLYGPKSGTGLLVARSVLNPPTPPGTAGGSYRIGTVINPIIAGRITGARFWRNTISGLTTRQLFLYDDTTQALLATSAATTETGGFAGWVSVTFATPIDVAAGNKVLVCFDENANFVTSGATTGPPAAPATDPTYAVFFQSRYGTYATGFPSPGTNDTYYYIDLIWQPAAGEVWPVAVPGFVDAPSDGQKYVRKNGAWVVA